MVFENVFANVINTYLSGFVDDVNSNQLKLGAWKGRLELTNLSVKENALDALDLPFNIKHGRIGMLSASIPWSSIYTSPVVFKLSNILVVAVPNVDIVSYDEEKEKKSAEAIKQKLLAQIEESLLKAKEKEDKKRKNDAGNDDKSESKDDFVTKLTAQIIKNLQVRIDKVHVRFEDNFTDAVTPYVAGITLDQLIFETESSTDKSSRYSNAASDDIIYKLVSLKNLSVYWNVLKVCDEEKVFISWKNDVNVREEMLLETIASDDFIPQDLDYVLKPITFTADAMINRKPHVDDFRVPVLDIDVSLNDFQVGFHRKQFESLLMLLESLGRMKLAYPHRRWRPKVAIQGNSKDWWRFAITAVMENDVKRKFKSWSWAHMKNHRMKIKEYLEAYQEKLLKPNNKTTVERVTLLEQELDVFNIILARRKAETVVAPKLKQLQSEKQEKKKSKGSGGWFGGWWGSSKSDEDDDSAGTSVNVIEDFKKEMTQEEKDKLYSAIGYGKEGSALTDYPLEFAAHLLSLELQSITLVLIDDAKFGITTQNKILEVSLINVETRLEHRPASSGFEITSSVDDMTVLGMKNRPLIREETPEKAFIIDFTANPVHQQFDFGVTIKTNPLHFVYDPSTVNSLVNMFTPQQKRSARSLQQIQAMAEARLSRLKTMSATGLEYAISKHRDLNIHVDFAPFFVIIPHDDQVWDDEEDEDEEEFKDAFMASKSPSDCLIVCLGRVQIESESFDRKRSFDVKSLSKRETPESIIALARERAYESYKFKLSEVQIILSKSSSWKNDIGFNRGNEYSIHGNSHVLLKPICLDIFLQRCIIHDDPDLPLFKVKAVVPSVSVVASDAQLLKSLAIIQELPTPGSTAGDAKDKESLDYGFGDSYSIGPTLDQPDNYAIAHEALMQMDAIAKDDSEDSGHEDNDTKSTPEVDAGTVVKDITDFSAEFIIKEVSCDLYRELNQGKNNQDIRSKSSLIKLSIRELGASAMKSGGEGSPTTIILKFKMTRMDFVLIESAVTSDCPAVIFNNFLEIDIKQRDNQTSLVGKVGEIQLSVTNLKRYQELNEVEAFILQPCDLDFIGRLDGESNTKRLDVIMDEVKLNISPNTVQVVMSILSSVVTESKGSESLESSLEMIRPNDLLTAVSLEGDSSQYWFLKKGISEALEMTEDTRLTEEVTKVTPQSPTKSGSSATDANDNRDQLMMKMPSIKVILESGGTASRPILQFETSLSGRLDSWCRLSSNVTLLMTYYNERVTSWEPVIEPIDASGKVWCTELKATIGTGDDASKSGPKISASLESHDRLEVTISKTFLSVLNRLGETFAKAVKKSEKLSVQRDITQVTNCLGMDMMIIVDESKYTFEWERVESAFGYSTLILYPNEQVELTRCKPLTKTGELTHRENHNQDDTGGDFVARLVLNGNEINRSIALKNKCQKVFNIPVIHYPVSRLRCVIDVDVQHFGNKKVTFGTPIKLVNNMQRAIDVYKLVTKVIPAVVTDGVEENDCVPVTRVEETAVKFSSVDAGSSWYLPLNLVFSDTELIFFSAGDDYCIPNQGVPFKDLSRATGKSLLIKCEPKTNDKPCVNLQVVSSTQDLLFEETNQRIAKCIILEINPTLVLQNLLPLSVKYTLSMCNERVLNQGEKHHLGQFDPDNPRIEILIPNYLEKTWKCIKKVEARNFDEDDVSVWSFAPVTVTSSIEETSPVEQHLVIAMSLSKPYPSKPVLAQLFAPFWLINRTGMKLTLKSGDIIWNLPPDASLPLLFSFKAGKLFKQKLQMKIQESSWSDSFSIDAVGNQGNVLCRGTSGKSRDSRLESKATYCVSIDIALSSFSLTKIVTFSPFYSVINRTKIFVEVSDDQISWFPVNATSKISFWPKEASCGKFFVRCNNFVSCPVSFKESNSALITVGHDLLFNILVDVTDSGVQIQLSDYDEGSCPVKIFNALPQGIEYWQQGFPDRKSYLPSFHSVYFLWQEPTRLRHLVWKILDHSVETEETVVELIQDTFGSVEKKQESKDNIFWVSFLDGKQRTLLISMDSGMTTAALQAAEFTQPNVTLDVSFKGLGVSVVNDDLQRDLIYMGVSGCDTVWEVKKAGKSKRWKALQVKQMEAIEAAYQRELTRRKIQAEENLPPPTTSSIKSLPHKIKVDMTDVNNIVMLEPVRGVLRRYSSPGFFAKVITSDHVVQVHAKINRIQIDNQQDNCPFNIIMCPVTPPKSLSSDRAPKPFIELSAVLQKTANLNRFKYLSVLIQEFLVQIDGAFLLSVSEFFGASSYADKEIDYEKLISKDIKQLTHSEEINDESEVILSKAYYDMIHFSPIKVHVSFSLGGVSSFQVFGVLDLLLRSAGVTLTEFKDVTFKIDFFERKNILLDNQQLVSQATTHYMRQVLKQFYVIVLGLDVIGNPVGLVLGLKQGVGDFFYEPFMGIIEGPEEFAEGLALGVKSLFSHTFGGAAGALSKITGTLGEGVSALTMDDDFIRRRRMRMQRKQNVAESGKELAQGFWRGLTGIIRKPIEGARDDGFEGLVKGIGKGAVGILAQPATGVIDFASGSLGALRRAVDINAEAKKQRPARFFKPDNILRPYNRHEATGNQMLQMLDKGSFASTDYYLTHCTLIHPANPSREVIVLITDHRVFVLKNSVLYNTLEIEWKEDFLDIQSIDIHNLQVIKFLLKEERTKFCIVNEGNERFLYCQSPDAAQWLLEKLTAARSKPTS